MAMVRVLTILLLGACLAYSAAAAETEAPAGAAKCLKAEINPVTGHVLCIDPLGAPVEAPPEEAKLPCKPEDVRGQWSYGPNCTPMPEGM
jgi:hypothetical protein